MFTWVHILTTLPPSLQNIQPWSLSVILLITFLMTEMRVILQIITPRKSCSETASLSWWRTRNDRVSQPASPIIITNCDPLSVHCSMSELGTQNDPDDELLSTC